MVLSLFLAITQIALASPEWRGEDLVIVNAPKSLASVKKRKSHAKSRALSSDSREDCEASLRAALCVNDETIDSILANWNRLPCAADSADYLPAAMEIHDELPPKMRPLYCSLHRIFLSDKLWSIAYASPIRVEQEVTGGFISFRKSAFTGKISASKLLTWKEQIAYGGSKDYLADDHKLPRMSVDFKLDHMKSSALYYVVLHELAHLVDYQNNANKWWEPLSWLTLSTPKMGKGFLHQRDLCFYNCYTKLKLEQAYPMYDSMRNSAFITSYSGISAYEDFAEFWTWRSLRESNEPSYKVLVPGHPALDMMPAFDSPLAKEKMKRIQEMWDSPATKIGF